MKSRILFSISIMLASIALSASDAKQDSHSHTGGEIAANEDDHRGNAEQNDSVGPDKGVLEMNQQDGFRLSSEAIQNFLLKDQSIAGNGPWSIPRSAILFSGSEMNLFRHRGQFYKRIDFQIERKTESEIVVRSKELRSGDSVVVEGIGFLRISELAASGGASEGHSH